MEEQAHANLWLDRAAVAYKRGNVQLSRAALTRFWQYQRILADQTGKDLPEQPEPNEFFNGWTDEQFTQAEARVG